MLIPFLESMEIVKAVPLFAIVFELIRDKLESYIDPKGFDVAQFYADIEGNPEDKNVKLALEEMKFFCKRIDILGVYKMSDFRKK